MSINTFFFFLISNSLSVCTASYLEEVNYLNKKEILFYKNLKYKMLYCFQGAIVLSCRE